MVAAEASRNLAAGFRKLADQVPGQRIAGHLRDLADTYEERARLADTDS